MGNALLFELGGKRAIHLLTSISHQNWWIKSLKKYLQWNDRKDPLRCGTSLCAHIPLVLVFSNLASVFYLRETAHSWWFDIIELTSLWELFSVSLCLSQLCGEIIHTSYIRPFKVYKSMIFIHLQSCATSPHSNFHPCCGIDSVLRFVLLNKG